MRRATHTEQWHCKPQLFQSTLSMRRATYLQSALNTISAISIHALHEESDRQYGRVYPIRLISIHALHEESDYASEQNRLGTSFQSTLSMRRATVAHGFVNPAPKFQSTLSMRRATRHDRRWTPRRRISIHALHEESDALDLVFDADRLISIHALHEESDFAVKCRQQRVFRFQSTLSMRRATICAPPLTVFSPYFNPRSP